METFTAAVDRHGDGEAAVQAVRALRRRELFRIASADLLGAMPNGIAPVGAPLDTVDVGQALADVTDATLGAALRVARSRVRAMEMPFAVIGMGRLGGSEVRYASDADVLFVDELPSGTAEDAASGTAHQIAERLRRLLAAPSPEPPLGIDADLRPEGRQGPLVRSLAAYERYYAEWSRIWEAQALLRARFVGGDRELGRGSGVANRVRYPAHGLTAEQITEIRRIKAQSRHRTFAPRCGSGDAYEAWPGWARRRRVDGATAPVAARLRGSGAAHAPTLDALAAAREAGLVPAADAASLTDGWLMATRVRNALMLVRGRPSDQLPRQGVELAGVARAMGRPSSVQAGEFSTRPPHRPPRPHRRRARLPRVIRRCWLRHMRATSCGR